MQERTLGLLYSIGKLEFPSNSRIVMIWVGLYSPATLSGCFYTAFWIEFKYDRGSRTYGREIEVRRRGFLES